MKTGLGKVLYLTFLSQPAQDRQVYRAIKRLQANSVVELGVGDARRSLRMIAMLLRFHPPGDVHYTGVDLFEARPDSSPGMTLKRAHRIFAEQGVRTRLIPGDPYSALARSANSLTGTDLVVVGAGNDTSSLADAWFYLPRMLHEKSLVLLQNSGESEDFQILTPGEVAQRVLPTASRAA